MVLDLVPHNSRIKKKATIRARESRHPGPAVASPKRAPGSQHEPTDIRLGRILRLLTENATVVVSGTKIAQEISSNRSEVWRLIQQLRGLGVDVAGHPATGYQLRSVPDLLLPEILQPLIRGTIFDSHLHHYYKIGSTNVTGMSAAADGAPEGSVFGGGADRRTRPGCARMALDTVRRDLLFRGAASCAAAVGSAGVVAGSGIGR